MNYEECGVGISAGDSFVEIIKGICASTYTDAVVEGVGGFCSLFRLPHSNKLLAASTDGVGTKLLLADNLADFGCLKAIGIDLVAMVVNDIITCGAQPLFMLDCYSLSHLSRNLQRSVDLVQGIADGCKLSQCFCLIGGETAEMPDIYTEHTFDIAGFGVGLVDESERLGPHKVKNGDVVIGIPSSGPHSNGFTLIRHAFRNYDWIRDSLNIREWIMRPTRIYTSVIKNLDNVHAAAHITGGGLEFNTSRSIPQDLKLTIDWNSWERPIVFDEIQRRARVEEEEMRRVFNCGIGFTLIVDANEADTVIKRISLRTGILSQVIGSIGK